MDKYDFEERQLLDGTTLILGKRNTGKTTALIQKAIDTGATLVVANLRIKEQIERESRHRYGYSVKVITYGQIKDYTYTNEKIIIDDLLFFIHYIIGKRILLDTVALQLSNDDRLKINEEIDEEELIL